MRWTPVMLAVLLGAAGCRGGSDQPESAGPAAIEDTVERGPVTMTVSADADAITVGDAVVVTVEVIAEPFAVVRMPQFESEMGEQLYVLERSMPADLPVDGKRRWVHTYEVTTFDTGTVEVPPITVTFTDDRDAEDPIEGELVSEPLPIEVASVLGDATDPGAFHDVADPIDVPLPSRIAPWWWAVVFVPLAVVVALFLGRRKRLRVEREAESIVIPAHEWALAELDRLERDALLTRGEADAFYHRLSGIVREYVERRYGLMAPERTTEEFLREMERSPVLRADDKPLLAAFLRSADLVKFARHEPGPEEGDDALATARRFVEETAERAAEPGGSEVA